MFEFEYNDEIAVETKIERRLIGEGDAHFLVKSAENCISKAGNPQLKVVLTVSSDGITNTVWEYFPATKKFADKLKGFLNGIGKIDLYNQGGRLDENKLIGCEGACFIKHETSSDPQYGTQPKVKFYYDKSSPSKAHHVEQALNHQKSESDKDWEDIDGMDEIPF